MKLTTKGRFAVTAMLDIAMNCASDDSVVPLCDIAKRQNISNKYLGQILYRLQQEGLVVGVRGRSGGYRLGRKAELITIDQIIHAVDENTDTSMCGGDGTCHGGAKCLTHHLWLDLNSVIDDFLSGVTLAALVQSQHLKHEEKHTAPYVVRMYRRNQAEETNSNSADEASVG